MARRPHPYFGHLNRLDAARPLATGEAGDRVPLMKAGEQEGVLWQAFRETEST